MISFIIPTLREESVLEKTLIWLSSYTGEKEIIISDGRSDDKTLEIARKYTDKIIIYEGTKRQTIGMGRNLGASIASGKYLVFLDADMVVLDPDRFFAIAVDTLNKTRGAVALTAFMRVLPELETWKDRTVFGGLNYLYVILNNILHIGGASGEFQMVRTKAFHTIGGFNPLLVAGEDHEHFRRLAKIGRTISARNLTIYHTGRRAHKVGWAKLLFTWGISFLPMSVRKMFIKEWVVVR